MIAIIDYGMGNLRSVQKAFEHVRAIAEITQEKEAILRADKVVLPGVGAMSPAMNRLKELDLLSTITQIVSDGKPFLGICLGFQLLFETSSEGGETGGLGILKGRVDRFRQLKIPQIGWNRLNIKSPESPLFKGIGPSAYVYFCHSYFVQPADQAVISSTTEYAVEFTSSVRKGNIFGVQFHPEKSQKTGLRILKNFSEL